MSRTGPQKFAILLCKFSDTAQTEPNPTAFYEDLFVKRGTGGLNDYWIAASLGAINLDGSQVFGWRTLETTRAAYLAAHPSRGQKVRGAIDAFQLDQTKYLGVIALFNADMTDGGTEPPNLILAQPGDVQVTFLAHEMGHVLGLEHSFDHSTRQMPDAQQGEYFDPQDIMSANAVYSDAVHRFSPRGPLLNTPNLDRMGWLPRSRVWQPWQNSSTSYDIDIVALEHPEVPGFLAAHAGGWIAEFRMPDGFDQGLTRAAVYFHDESANPNSFIIASDPTNYVQAWQPGQVFGNRRLYDLSGGTLVTVVGFDLAAKTARLRIQVKAMRPPFIEPDVYYGLGIGQLPHHGVLLVVRGGRLIGIPVPVPEPHPILPGLHVVVRSDVLEVLNEDVRKIVGHQVSPRS